MILSPSKFVHFNENLYFCNGRRHDVTVSCLSHAFASVHCCLVVTRERSDLLALLGYVYCIFDTFTCGILVGCGT